MYIHKIALCWPSKKSETDAIFMEESSGPQITNIPMPEKKQFQSTKGQITKEFSAISLVSPKISNSGFTWLKPTN